MIQVLAYGNSRKLLNKLSFAGHQRMELFLVLAENRVVVQVGVLVYQGVFGQKLLRKLIFYIILIL